ncbi:predicted protein [Methanosarcina acetivorans C2A]|jgi:hypothetical protein|uniref:Uncharacterized protein n=1 Tax=Methanosarcina acetivorans (strain ATCC 35395 / DSM 2834 / JCM 12185 / C2A) TaxID=188937 RepID=Q8TKD7_METAC|nr:predicted protein [Methanosarcina acetivorans C2A]
MQVYNTLTTGYKFQAFELFQTNGKEEQDRDASANFEKLPIISVLYSFSVKNEVHMCKKQIVFRNDLLTCKSQEFSVTESYAIVTHSAVLIPDCKIFRKNYNPNNPLINPNNPKW